MATYQTGKRGVAWRTWIMLPSYADPTTFQTNPTLATGDVKVQKDGGALANITTLPSVAPSASRWVQVDLSATEMTADVVGIQFVDQTSPAEWIETYIPILTTARQLDDLAYPATSGRSSAIDANGATLLQTGTGTGQLDFTSGVVKANLVQYLASAFGGTAAQVVAAFQQFFDVASPTGTMKAITNVVTTTTATNLTTNNDKTGYALSTAGVQAIWDALVSNLTTVGSIGARLVADLTGDIYARLGAPAGASHAADIAAVKVDTAAVKVQTDKLAFTVTNQVDANVIDWKGSAAPAMTGDAFARLGAPAGASVSADVAATKALLPTALTANGNMKSSLMEIISTAATESGAGRLMAGLKKFFDVVTPASTMELLTAVTTLTTYTGNTPQTGDSYPKVDTEVATLVTGVADIQSRIPAALVSGRIDASVGAMASNVITAAAAASDFGVEVGAAVWATTIDAGHSALQYFRVVVAVLVGKVSGADTNAPKFRDPGDTKNRVSATTDVYGNRSDVTLDES